MDDDYEYQPAPKSPIPAAVVASIVTTMVVFFSLRALEDRGAFKTAKRDQAAPTAAVDVPVVLGMRTEQAREVLKGRDLLLSFSAERDSAKYPAGTVAEQMPLPGSQLPRGGVVQAALSSGVRQVAVPKLAGLPAAQAAQHLVAAGLALAPQKVVASELAAAGTVIETEPPAATVVAPQQGVALVVSSGASVKAVPKVAGMRARAARALLEEQGWTVGKIRYDSNEDRSSGIVLVQKPAAATLVPPGTPIELTINED